MEPEKYFSINQSQVIRGMREKCTFIRMWKFIRPIKEMINADENGWMSNS